MTRRIAILSLVLAGCAAAALVWLQNDPLQRESRRIRERLLALAQDASFTEADPPFKRLSYPNRVAPYFASPTELQIDRFNANQAVTRAELEQGAGALRAGQRGLQIEFLDIQVVLPSATATNAEAHLTSRIYFTGDADYWVQEFRLQLVKSSGEWLVRNLATVRTMEQ